MFILMLLKNPNFLFSLNGSSSVFINENVSKLEFSICIIASKIIFGHIKFSSNA